MYEKLVLKLEHIHKQLPSDFLLNDINLKLYSGEIHIVMGENGSGKSCLLQIVSGYHQPDKGCMEIDGKIISFTNRRRELNSNTVIYIQQNANILQNLTVAENIYYNQMPYKNN